MAHQLAEYLQAEHTAKRAADRAAARDAASNLITRLWEARDHWPRGWPPAGASKLRNLLEPRERYSSSRADSDSAEEPWLRTYQQLQQVQQDEQRTWVYAAAAELDLDAIEAAVEAGDTAGGGDDVEYLKDMLSLRKRSDAWFAEHAQKGEKVTRRSHRVQIVQRVLAQIANERAQLIERSVAEARSYRRRRRTTGDV